MDGLSAYWRSADKIGHPLTGSPLGRGLVHPEITMRQVDSKIELPLLTQEEAAPQWEGWTPLSPLSADSIYLGLKYLSARAEAENLTLEQVDEITSYAHSLTPRRSVFVTINTLFRQDEMAEFVEVVAALDEIGVDALVIQDLGVYHLV